MGLYSTLQRMYPNLEDRSTLLSNWISLKSLGYVGLDMMFAAQGIRK